MLDPKFIGRAENQTKTILQNILQPEEIFAQVPLLKLISKTDFDRLDIVIQQHKFDFMLLRQNDVLVIEVNYKHRATAARRWLDIFTPYLKASKVFGGKKIIPVAINDWDCTSLFKHDRSSTKPIRITDIIDVCNALYTAGVKTCL